MQSNIKIPTNTFEYFNFSLYRQQNTPLKKITVEICANKEVHSRNKIKVQYESNANLKTFILQTDSPSLNDGRQSSPKPYFVDEILEFKE
jgi:hypothetical protein